MKFTIDTKAKTVTVHSIEKLGPMFEELKAIMGDGWGEYAVIFPAETVTVPLPYRVYPQWPYYHDWNGWDITVGSTPGAIQMCNLTADNEGNLVPAHWMGGME